MVGVEKHYQKRGIRMDDNLICQIERFEPNFGLAACVAHVA